MEKKVKQRGAVIRAQGNQRGGITARVATDIMIEGEKVVLENGVAVKEAKNYIKSEYELRKAQLEALMANPKASPARIAKLQETLNNLKGH